MGRNNYPREHRSSGQLSSSEKDSAAAAGAQKIAAAEGQARSGQQLTLAGLDSRINSMQQDLRHALNKVSTKDCEKLELIFSILKELQVKQGQLEETVRVLHTQCGGANGADGEQPSGQQQQQLGRLGPQRLAYHHGRDAAAVANVGQMQPGAMNAQAPVQQYQAMMQADGSQAIFAPMQQVVMVSSAPGGMQPMQYAVPLQHDGTMQPIAAMQFVGQAPPANAHFCQWAGSEAAAPQPQVVPPAPRPDAGGAGPSKGGASPPSAAAEGDAKGCKTLGASAGAGEGMMPEPE